MLYRGTRKTAPSTRYGVYLEVIESTGWTWQEMLSQPADLVDEYITKLAARAQVQEEQAKKAERDGKTRRR